MYYENTWDKVFHEMDSQPNVVAFGRQQSLEHVTKRSCNYKVIPGWSVRKVYSFFVAKNSPYRELFNRQ